MHLCSLCICIQLKNCKSVLTFYLHILSYQIEICIPKWLVMGILRGSRKRFSTFLRVQHCLSFFICLGIFTKNNVSYTFQLRTPVGICLNYTCPLSFGIYFFIPHFSSVFVFGFHKIFIIPPLVAFQIDSSEFFSLLKSSLQSPVLPVLTVSFILEIIKGKEN